MGSALEATEQGEKEGGAGGRTQPSSEDAAAAGVIAS